MWQAHSVHSDEAMWTEEWDFDLIHSPINWQGIDQVYLEAQESVPPVLINKLAAQDCAAVTLALLNYSTCCSIWWRPAGQQSCPY